jgi:hypothetical protein
VLFSDRVSKQEMLEARGADREDLLAMLLDDFRQAFPELTFELQLDFAVINAQALKLGDQPIVTIYGGLALHPMLGAQSLTFILLHEVGHLLAGGCRSKRDRSLACECASDHWAMTVGTDTLFRKSGRHLDMRIAVEELTRALGSGQPSRGKYTDKHINRASTSGCWAGGWFSRSRALLKRIRPPISPGCCFTTI